MWLYLPCKVDIDFLLLHLLLQASFIPLPQQARMKNCLSRETYFILSFYSVSRNSRRTPRFIRPSESVHARVKVTHFSEVCLFQCLSFWSSSPPFYSLLSLYFHGKHAVMTQNYSNWVMRLLSSKRGENWSYVSPYLPRMCTHKNGYAHTPLLLRLRLWVCLIKISIHIFLVFIGSPNWKRSWRWSRSNRAPWCTIPLWNVTTICLSSFSVTFWWLYNPSPF